MILRRPLLEADKVLIIESLQQGKTGKRLYEDLDVFALSNGYEELFSYCEVANRSDFLLLLDTVRLRCLEGQKISIHVEAHGSPQGLLLADNTRVAWAEVYRFFEAINQASSNNLFVGISACHGFSVVNCLKLSTRAPFCCIVGPLQELPEHELFVAFVEFYKEWLSGDFEDAVGKFTAKENEEQRFGALITDLIVHQALKHIYERDYRNRNRKEEQEDQLTHLISFIKKSQLAMPPLKELRNHLKPNLDEVIRQSFEQTYNKYMFVDPNSNTDRRFRFNSERIFQSSDRLI